MFLLGGEWEFVWVSRETEGESVVSEKVKRRTIED